MIKVIIEEDGKKLKELEGIYTMVSMIGDDTHAMFLHGHTNKARATEMVTDSTAQAFKQIHKDCPDFIKPMINLLFLEALKKGINEDN